MNKKWFTIFLIAVFILASISLVSAADSSDDDDSSSKRISVSINWNDNGQTSARPGSVSVSLIKDGSVVETKTLSSSNSWSATFNAKGDGSYSVQESGASDYSVSISGSASKGFVITNTLNKDVLGAVEDDNDVEEEDALGVAANPENLSVDDGDSPILADQNNTTDKNNTETGNQTNTENETDIDDEPETDDDTDTDDETGSVVVTEKTTKVIKQETKKVDKKPKNVTKNKMRHTGIPIIGLVLVMFVAAFVPFSRKK